jgi:DNA-directed RNA polymerase subunit K/omega
VTKYEYARLMGARVTELSANASPMTAMIPADCVGALLALAEREFEEGKLPLALMRRLPSREEKQCARALRRVSRTMLSPTSLGI